MYKIQDQNGATVTIFVPYDCNNNCPFCINKIEYEDKSNFSMDKILESIKTIHEITPNCNFVLTGGEPLANLEGFSILIKSIPKSHKIFVNTSLPSKNDNEFINLINFLNKFKDDVSCINISRHIHPYVEDFDPLYLKMLKIPYRINCVVQEVDIMENCNNFLSYIIKLQNHTPWIQFRKDYTTITPENLYNAEDDIIFKTLKKIYKNHTSFNKEKIRIGYRFDSPKEKMKNIGVGNNCLITYHKTLPYSKIEDENGDYILYDIIIKQDGRVEDDWNNYGNILNLEEYKRIFIEKNKEN